MTKARLFSLLITVSIVLSLLASFGVRPGGFSDGGFW